MQFPVTCRLKAPWTHEDRTHSLTHVHLSVCLSVYLSIYLSIYPSIFYKCKNSVQHLLSWFHCLFLALNISLTYSRFIHRSSRQLHSCAITHTLCIPSVHTKTVKDEINVPIALSAFRDKRTKTYGQWSFTLPLFSGTISQKVQEILKWQPLSNLL